MMTTTAGAGRAAEHLAHAAGKQTPDGFRLMALAAAATEIEAAITEEVAQMRAQGDTWARIATCLGVTRQAATKRYGTKSIVRAADNKLGR